MAQLTLKEGDSPGRSKLVTWAHRSRELFPVGGKRGKWKKTEGLKQETDLVYHGWFEDEGNHMRRKAGNSKEQRVAEVDNQQNNRTSVLQPQGANNLNELGSSIFPTAFRQEPN